MAKEIRVAIVGVGNSNIRFVADFDISSL